MKLFLVVCLSMVAGCLGGYLGPYGGYGGVVAPVGGLVGGVVAPVGVLGGSGILGTGAANAVGGGNGVGAGASSVGGGAASGAAARSAGALRDSLRKAYGANTWNNAASDYGRTNGAYGDRASRSGDKAQAASSGFGAKSGDWHNTANAGSRAANKAAFSDIAQNKWGERNDKNFADAAQLWKKGDQFYNGRRNKDNIDYAYDKSFDLRDSENGGYEVDEAASAHALDDYADKSASYDRNIDKNAAWASAADAQSADRKAAAGRRASNSDSNWDNFARSASSANAANGRNKDWAQKLDTSEGSSGLFTDTRRSASDIYKDLALADSSYGRNNKVFGGKGVRQGEGVVAYGIAGIGGYAARPVLVGPGAAYAAGPVALGGVGIALLVLPLSLWALLPDTPMVKSLKPLAPMIRLLPGTRLPPPNCATAMLQLMRSVTRTPSARTTG
ncbi:fibroin heavy chain-like [Pomacea canaliculata]|uniref:fibroin heavy chain-like n=1 Tax=Pomacea canaliculata TaxID=400727 RepID=UPI000D738E6E|nr:fibroin heavy chain-like [Pomacea canaliculata]